MVTPATLERVAILSYPGNPAFNVLLACFQEVPWARQTESFPPSTWTFNVPKTGGSSITRLQVLFSFHVPPYGYGRNHGLSKILRLTQDPKSILMDTGTSAGGTIANDGTTFEEQEMTPLDRLRNYMRWHCRLTHVSAHTRMLSAGVWSPEQGIQDWRKPIDFIDLNPDQALSLSNCAESAGKSHGDLWRPGAVETALALGLDNAGGNAKVIKVIEEETNSLKDWPCKPFIGSEAGFLNPLCGSEFDWIKCSVPWDICGKQTCT